MSQGHARPIVSVITNFLDGGDFIAEAIESVLAQTCDAVEHILVDDGSTDRATAIAKGYAARFPDRIRYVDHPGHANLGTSASRNVGIREARGEFIAFLDADDVYLPTKLERQIALLEAHPECGTIYGAHVYWHGWTGRPEDVARDWTWDHFGVPPDSVAMPPELVRHYLKDGLTVPCPTTILVRRALVDRVGGFDASFRSYYDDQVFFCKVALAAPVFVSSECLEKYRQHPASLCANEGTTTRALGFRKTFLEWLERYLLERHVFDPAIWSSLELELLQLRNPRIKRWSRAGRKFGRNWKRTFGTARHAFTSLRRRSTIRVLRSSRLIDAVDYESRARAAGFPTSGIDPVLHYVAIGANAGLHPHPLFDPDFYATTYDDVRATGLLPLEHFVRIGAREGRRPCPWFDTAYYLRANPDIATSSRNPLAHFVREGWKEGRRPSRRFDAEGYTRAHPELRTSGMNPLVHLALYGSDVERAAATPASTPTDDERQARLDAWSASMASHSNRALYLDLTTPRADKDAGSLLTLANMHALTTLGFAVSFLPMLGSDDDRYVDELVAHGFASLDERVVVDPLRFVREFGHRFELVVISRLDVARDVVDVVRASAPDALIVFETVDLHFLRERRRAELLGSAELARTADATRVIELDTIARCDATIVHSDAERRLLADALPDALVGTVPCVTDPRPRHRGRAGRDGIVFIGSYSHEPNVDAVLWFAREVLPLVRRELPEAVFRIVGSDMTPAVSALHGGPIDVVGFVPDLDPLMDACVMTVAPLRFGAGYKGKIATSLAFGVPVVCTAIAAEGMGFTDGVEVVIADDAASMARAIVSLHLDALAWDRMSDAGRRFVLERFSSESARTSLKSLIDEAATRKTTRRR